jgi:hypothetical protein
MTTKATKSTKTELGQKATKQTVNPHVPWALKRIEILDARLGKGVGAKRERERIAKILA